MDLRKYVGIYSRLTYVIINGRGNPRTASGLRFGTKQVKVQERRAGYTYALRPEKRKGDTVIRASTSGLKVV